MSKQDYGTPPDFLAAVADRFGEISWDLACRSDNCVARGGFMSDRGMDALSEGWYIPGNLWCNPPFSNISPWAEKCARYRNRLGWILLLVPASTDSDWYYDHVNHRAFVMPLRQRIQFIGADYGYPKPLMLVAYGYGISGFDPWDWKGTK